MFGVGVKEQVGDSEEGNVGGEESGWKKVAESCEAG